MSPSPTPAPDAAPSPAPPGDARALVTVHRTGGLAGRQDTVVVDADGRWTATRRTGSTTGGRLSARQLGDLEALLAGSAWHTEAARAPGRPCPDGFRYQVIAGGRTVRTDDCLLESQPALAELTSGVISGAGL